MLVRARPPVGAEQTPRLQSAVLWRRIWRHPLFWSGLGLLLFLLLFSFLGPVFYHKDVNTIDVGMSLLPPSPTFPLGTDVLGENELGRLMIGGQVPVWSGLLCALGATALGTMLGIAGGFGGRLADGVTMRLADGVMGIPQVVAILIAESIFGISTALLVLVFILTAWPLTARLVRAQTLALRVAPFVDAARAEGAGFLRLVARHLLPNLFDALVATFTTQFTNAVLVIAITSFVGAGLGPPWNWATMINENRDALLSGQWWLIVLPGALFALLVVSVYLTCEALRAAFNPQADISPGGEAVS